MPYWRCTNLPAMVPAAVGLSLVNFESTLSKATSNFSRLILLRPPVLARGTRSKREAQASCKQLFLKGLILAQNERWRRGLGMQVEREPLGNWWGKWRKGQ